MKPTNIRTAPILATLALGLAVAMPVQADQSDADGKRSASRKSPGSFSVQILGSGGPIATAKGRASAGYLIYVEGKPRILMDVGGGSFQRLARSGADLRDLDTILLSHLHVDHTADLSAAIKTIYFHNNLARGNGTIGPLEGRTAPVNIYGPDITAFPQAPGGTYPNGELIFPSTSDYVDDHYSIGPTPGNPEATPGTERYLSAFVNAISQVTLPDGTTRSVSKFAYRVTNLNSDWRVSEPELVLEDDDGLRVTALAINHGPVPNVAYRIEYGGKSIVYTGDTSSRVVTPNGSFISQALIDFARDADLLIYDTAITNELPTTPIFRALHTTPDDLGVVAAESGTRKLVLSHITPVTEPRLDEVRRAIRDQGYRGKMVTARDLKIYRLLR